MVSGSSDNTIRIWDIECGACLRMLEGHDDLVRYLEIEKSMLGAWGMVGERGGMCVCVCVCVCVCWVIVKIVVIVCIIFPI